MMCFLSAVLLFFTVVAMSVDFGPCLAEEENSTLRSILGDYGMKNPNARFALEAWNACNEVGEEAPGMGSPRIADCADLNCSSSSSNLSSSCVHQKVNESDNQLKAGDAFPGTGAFNSSNDVDKYAVEKEKYLGSLCEKRDNNESWYFWMVMLKNGNLDTNANICPENGRKVNKTEWTFPCFGTGCMNQPLMYRNESRLDNRNSASSPSLTGEFYGSYDLDYNVTGHGTAEFNKSYFSVSWQKTNHTGTDSWKVSFKLTTSPNYPWLMLYLRADAASGRNGGYHYDGRGMMKNSSLPESPNFMVKLTLDVKQGGGNSSQFYLTDIGGCWKNNGLACDGDVTTDVTRYSEMIINPQTGSSCTPTNLAACPPYHTNTTTGEKIYKTDTNNFPYSAYHLYCAPGNAQNVTENKCDPYSNPQQQELVQLLPHSEWSLFGYPATKEDVSWEAGPKYWSLNTGNLSDGLYFYQDPGTPRARRIWTSINVGTEIYNVKSDGGQNTAEWSVSDFDVLVPK